MTDSSGDDCSRWCIEACAATAVGTTTAQQLLDKLAADNGENQEASSCPATAFSEEPHSLCDDSDTSLKKHAHCLVDEKLHKLQEATTPSTIGELSPIDEHGVSLFRRPIIECDEAEEPTVAPNFDNTDADIVNADNVVERASTDGSHGGAVDVTIEELQAVLAAERPPALPTAPPTVVAVATESVTSSCAEQQLTPSEINSSHDDLAELQKRLHDESSTRRQLIELQNDTEIAEQCSTLAKQSRDHDIYTHINNVWVNGYEQENEMNASPALSASAAEWSAPVDTYKDLDASQFVADVVKAHNELRALHGVCPLTLDDELSEKAQQWAEKLSKRQFLTYADYAATGESATFFPAEFNGTKCMDIWGQESLRYDYEMPGWQQGTNYFTQMIWRTTTRIGVGRALMPPEHRCNNVQCSRALREHHQQLDDKTEQRYAVVVCLYRRDGTFAFATMPVYRPAGNGNRPGEFEKNVLKPLSCRPDANEDENR